MMQIVETIGHYLSANAVFTLFLCLGLGYLLGKLKIKSFTVGATMGTLIVGALISQFAPVEYNTVLRTVLYSMFCFTLGFDVGPAFFANFRSSGLKILALSVIFAGIGLGTVYALCQIFGLDILSGVGLMAGALTQTAIIEVAGFKVEDVAVVYGVTYIFGTLGVIIFAKNIAPLVLRKSLTQIAKDKVDKLAESGEITHSEPMNHVLQLRAYMMDAGSSYCGWTVEQFETKSDGRIEIEAIFRGDEVIHTPKKVKLLSGDVIQLLGEADALNLADELGLREVTDAKYYRVQMVDARIVLTEDFTENGAEILSQNGIIIRRTGKHVSFKKDSIIPVKGTQKAINNAAKILGYIKEEGNTTDIAYLSLAIALGMFVGNLALNIGGYPFSLTGSVGVLIIGLICGWLYERKPRVGHIPQATRLFLKSLGLNLYIAAVALGIGNGFVEIMKTNGLQIILSGVVITLLPHLLSLLIGKYILRIDSADLLGGLCGAGTCTAGLNALTDETNSSVFSLGYAPGCAAGNILLTVAGLIFTMIF